MANEHQLIQEHLGDGAYVTINRDFSGQVILTANHHEEHFASDKIHLDQSSLSALLRICKKAGLEIKL